MQKNLGIERVFLLLCQSRQLQGVFSSADFKAHWQQPMRNYSPHQGCLGVPSRIPLHYLQHATCLIHCPLLHSMRLQMVGQDDKWNPFPPSYHYNCVVNLVCLCSACSYTSLLPEHIPEFILVRESASVSEIEQDCQGIITFSC